MTLKLDELRSIRFANELDGALGKNKRLKIGAAVGRPDKWMAILKDRSTISVQPGAKLTSKMFNLNLNLEDLAGLKVARNPTRYPASGDFDKAKNVLVFPTCRIATNNLKFTNSGFEWQASDPKIQQPVQIGDEEEDDDQDPTPNFTSIQYAKGSPESTPTVWLAPPKALAAGTGKLRLTDGQRLTLGSENGFQITRLENRAVVISIADQEIKIPIEKVHSIDFPE